MSSHVQKAVESQSTGNKTRRKIVSAKLPKLTITKFDGSYENWLPFINKFEVEIDKTDLSPVTKFAYLKELLEAKVRADTDGLPLTTEDYERAKEHNQRRVWQNRRNYRKQHS